MRKVIHTVQEVGSFKLVLDSFNNQQITVWKLLQHTCPITGFVLAVHVSCCVSIMV